MKVGKADNMDPQIRAAQAATPQLTLEVKPAPTSTHSVLAQIVSAVKWTTPTITAVEDIPEFETCDYKEQFCAPGGRPLHSTAYLEAVNALTLHAPELTFEEIKAAIQAQIAAQTKLDAHDKLIMFVMKRSGFRRKGLTDEELIAAGRLGVAEAMRKHDLRKGAFSTIAYPYIAGAIREAFAVAAKTDGPKVKTTADVDTSLPEYLVEEAHLPTVLHEEKEKIALAEMDGLADEVDVINSESMKGEGMTPKEALAEGMDSRGGSALEANDPEYREPESGPRRHRPVVRTAATAICREMNGDREPGPSTALLVETKVGPALAAVMGLLSKQEFQIVRLHFYEEKTLKEIGALLHLSTSEVHRIEKEALQKLRGKPQLQELMQELRERS